MVKSSTYREHMKGRCTLLVISLMVIAHRVALRTGPFRLPLSCVRAGDRMVPSRTRNLLLEMKLCKKFGNWPFRFQWSRVRRIPYRQAVSLAFPMSKNTHTKC
jgi:hypothetical protein